MTSTETTTEVEETEETTTETPEGTETGAESGQEGTETPAEGEETGGGRNKALRERAQAAEERVTALEALVTEYRRDELARAARGAGMLDAQDFLDRHDVDEFLDEATGRLDQAAFDTVMTDLRERRRHLFRGGQRPAPDTSQGSSASGGKTTRGSTGETWQKVLSGKR